MKENNNNQNEIHKTVDSHITPEPQADMLPKKKSRKTIFFQAFFFIAMLLIVVYFVFKDSNIEEIGHILSNVNMLYVYIGFACALMFPLIQGRNLKLILGLMGEKITLLDGFKYGSTGFFFSSITPSATGGQPMQLVMMTQDRLSISHSSIALLLEVISYQAATFLLEISAVLYAFITKMELPQTIFVLCVLGMIMNFTFILFLFLVVFSNHASKVILKTGCWIIKHLPKMKQEKKDNLLNKAAEAIEEYHSCSVIIRNNLHKMINVFIFSLVEALCWFSIPFLVSRALGVATESYFVILVMQSFLYMSSALLPFPGAMGISEISFSLIFTNMYSESMMTTAILLNRGISFYFLLFFCGIVMLVGMLKHKKHDAAE